MKCFGSKKYLQQPNQHGKHNATNAIITGGRSKRSTITTTNQNTN